MNFKEKLNNVEIEGLTAMFNKFMQDYEDAENITNYGFFYCDKRLCSEDVANGHPIYFEGYKITSLNMSKNGLSYIICKNENENEIFFEFNCYNNKFYKIN